jgi:inorganic pyrophosphatase
LKKNGTLAERHWSRSEHPRLLHGSGSRAALPADDDPVDAAEIERAQVLEEGFDGEEAQGRRRLAQDVDPRDAVLAILHADAEPDVIALGQPGV